MGIENARASTAIILYSYLLNSSAMLLTVFYGYIFAEIEPKRMLKESRININRNLNPISLFHSSHNKLFAQLLNQFTKFLKQLSDLRKLYVWQRILENRFSSSHLLTA